MISYKIFSNLSTICLQILENGHWNKTAVDYTIDKIDDDEMKAIVQASISLIEVCTHLVEVNDTCTAGNIIQNVFYSIKLLSKVLFKLRPT